MSGWSNQAVSLVVLTEQTGGYSGLFGYSPSPGKGTLIFSVAAAAGTDPYGNSYPQGLDITVGSISGSTITGSTITGSTATFGVSGTGQTVLDSSGDILLSGADGEQVIRFNPNQKRLVVYSDPPGSGAVVVSIASAASSDQYGNSIPEGLNVAQGTITGTTFNGTDFVINSSGAFFYSSTPAAGNLIASIAPAAGTDAEGNAYLAGSCSYSDIAGTYYALVNNSGGLYFSTATSYAGPWTQQSSVKLISSGDLQFEAGTTQFYLSSAPYITAPLAALNGVTGSAPETWQSVTPPTGWTGTCRVKLLPVANLAVFDFELSGGTGTTFGALPNASYYPSHNMHRPFAMTGTNTGVPRVQLTTTGGFVLSGLPSTIPASVGATIVYPLD